jgi:magnesium transporter
MGLFYIQILRKLEFMIKKELYKTFSGLSDELKIILKDGYQIDNLDIEDVFTNTQLSKIEQRPQYLYVALEFPEYDKSRRHFVNKEIHCFISETYFLVVDKHNFKHFQQFHNLKDALLEKNSTPFHQFYEMLDFIITKVFRVLGKFRSEVQEIELQVFDDIEDDLVKEVLIIRRNLTNFMSTIYPLERVLLDLETKYTRFIDQRGIEKLDDSLDKIKKILNTLANFKEQLVLITEANESQIARSTNQVIKTLTVFNIIIFVPSLITGFFGMNTYFGWFSSHESLLPLLVVIITIIVATVVTFVYFKVRKIL